MKRCIEGAESRLVLPILETSRPGLSKFGKQNAKRQLWMEALMSAVSNETLVLFHEIGLELQQFHIHLLPIDDKCSGKYEMRSEA